MTLTPDAPVLEHGGRVLDWRPRFDPRSLQHRVGGGRPATLPTVGRLWKTGPVLDQGREGACVGFGCAGEAAAEPAPVPGITDRWAMAYYRRAQQLDEWPGASYEGTSVLAGCLTGRERGLWSGFQWATSAEELAAGIVRTASRGGGPAVIGVEWTAGSYDTDALGVLRPGGDVVGGHCVTVPGFVPADLNPNSSLARQLGALDLYAGYLSLGKAPVFVILNSWGPSFGKQGLALVPLEVMQAWSRAGAEFAVPTDRKVPTMTAAAQQDPETPEPVEATPREQVEHLTAVDLLDLTPPYRVELTSGDVLGQDTHTVRSVELLASGQQAVVQVQAVAGSFRLRPTESVTVRRSAG